MPEQLRTYNQKWLFGCGSLLTLLFLALAIGAIWSLQAERRLAHYPGARPIAAHANYRGLPTSLRWDDAYRTRDPFVDVYRWYSLTFDLGAEARAAGTCIELEGEQARLAMRQHVTVVICGTPRGQVVTVVRTYRVQTAVQLGALLNGRWFAAR